MEQPSCQCAFEHGDSWCKVHPSCQECGLATSQWPGYGTELEQWLSPAQVVERLRGKGLHTVTLRQVQAAQRSGALAAVGKLNRLSYSMPCSADSWAEQGCPSSPGRQRNAALQRPSELADVREAAGIAGSSTEETARRIVTLTAKLRHIEDERDKLAARAKLAEARVEALSLEVQLVEERFLRKSCNAC